MTHPVPNPCAGMASLCPAQRVRQTWGLRQPPPVFRLLIDTSVLLQALPEIAGARCVRLHSAQSLLPQKHSRQQDSLAQPTHKQIVVPKRDCKRRCVAAQAQAVQVRLLPAAHLVCRPRAHKLFTAAFFLMLHRSTTRCTAPMIRSCPATTCTKSCDIPSAGLPCLE